MPSFSKCDTALEQVAVALTKHLIVHLVVLKGHVVGKIYRHFISVYNVVIQTFFICTYTHVSVNHICVCVFLYQTHSSHSRVLLPREICSNRDPMEKHQIYTSHVMLILWFTFTEWECEYKQPYYLNCLSPPFSLPLCKAHIVIYVITQIRYASTYEETKAISAKYSVANILLPERRGDH